MIVYSVRVLNQLLKGFFSHSKREGGGLVYGFRCWPTDMDLYFHMNNASYARVAELCRWRALAEASKELGPALDRKAMYLVAEQKISYYKSISPLSNYEVSTTLSISDNKWLNFVHTFHGSTGDKKIIAEVQVKGVFKEASGKTIKPNELIDRSSLLKYCLKQTKGRTIEVFNS